MLRKGRPPESGVKRETVFQVRLTPEEKKTLEECAKTLNVSKSDIIRLAIQKLASESKKK